MALAIVLSLLAASERRLTVAINLYEEARFTDAKNRLLELIQSPDLAAEDRAEVLTYLGACYLALKDRGSARLQLRTLAREQPAAKPSRARFGPEFVALADEVWADEEKRRQAAASPPAPPPALTPEPKVEPPPPVAQPSRAVASLPLGIGHFARGQPVMGAVWLVAELGLFGVAAGTTAKLETLKRNDRPRTLFLSGSLYSADRPQADALNTAATAAFFAGLGLVALNVVIAYLTAVPQ